MSSINAYLDDYNKLVVEVSRRFYGGFTSGFYLSNDDGFLCECSLKERIEKEGEIVYILSFSKELKFGKRYYLYETHGCVTTIQHRFIVHTPQFHKQFTYTGHDLGSTYTRHSTSFALWAPTAVEVFLKLKHQKEVSLYPMVRDTNGVYRINVKGNLKDATYVYIVERNGEIVESLDPYGLSSTANGKESAVIDEEEILSIKDTKPHTSINHYCDAIIYECSIRDMTSSELTGTKTNRLYSSLTESGTSYNGLPTGLDYISSLGITHVQFQPVLDFETVDEKNPKRNYNWGYDPGQLITLEGSYSTNPDDPYARMKEFRKLVTTLHTRDIRVILDVVWNHMYSAYDCALWKCVPYYYFRYTENQYLSNGSYCGNDIESRNPMTRHLLYTAVEKLMTLYGIDGFRFDLMGILDIETMNEITERAQSIKKDAMVYGEGWDMPTALDHSEKTIIANHWKTLKIAFFNDTFRDVLKGYTADDQKYDKGFLTGSLEEAYDAYGAFSANSIDNYFRRFSNPTQSVNALETHDNATVWDKMHACCQEEPRDLRVRRQRLMIGCTFISQGIPFLHAGMEFCGTKQDNTNSYMAGDVINGMNWERREYNKDVVEYTKKCIAFRRSHDIFRLETSQEVNDYVRLEMIHDHMILYRLNRNDEHYMVVINPTGYAQALSFESGGQVIFDENGDYKEDIINSIEVPFCSMIVIKLHG